jgi:hypothetical protein
MKCEYLNHRKRNSPWYLIGKEFRHGVDGLCLACYKLDNIIIGGVDGMEPWSMTIEALTSQKAKWITKHKCVDNGSSKDYVQLSLRHGSCPYFTHLLEFPTIRSKT